MPINKFALFCPMVRACDMLEPRWTLLILAEMATGVTHFNDIRRGVPGISPGLLSKRLKQLEANGLVERIADEASAAVDYVRTDAARELDPIMEALGRWSYRNTDADEQLCNVDPQLLMWNMRRKIRVGAFPQRRVVLKFSYPAHDRDPRNFWLIVRPGEPVDVCFVDPGHDVDLFVTADLRAVASVFFGRSRLADELRSGRIDLLGSMALERSIESWFGLSSFATQ
ncbi:helix-turn-helix domain-containing protein [Mesorhizobium sp. KR9-304]|uniref:winged helix-turn-helix transcriptional regulator n=1 Tax=Mesorhizobium sp. KR9-304 TaxID=3156614 RepID=UPI0032B35BEC